MKYVVPVLGVLVLTMALSADAPPIDFSRDIRPILSDNCFACHGPDTKAIEGDLRLDVRDLATQANKHDRAAIVPGKPGESELVRRISAMDAAKIMPPPESNKKLTAEEKQLLRDWIAQGAVWGEHWSFEQVERPALPSVRNKAWPKNAIDYFTLARLEREGLTPSREASRETLIRRVAYDLTGMPPTLAEIDEYLSDKSPNAYEKMVDRYFAKPAYGERMALAWMDAARYGDSSVFHADGPRYMWGWRDWVINAYNNNMPFDQFTIEQLAGDLLPDATDWQRIATGFNRNHGTTDEGGVIFEEARVDYIVDRVKTTANVWMAISMECAQCHEHKYDPISQREYYAYYAFFNTSADPGRQTRNGNQAPVANIPDPARDAKLKELNDKIADIDKQIAKHKKDNEPAFVKWTVDEASRRANAGETVTMPDGLVAHFALDEGKGNVAADSTGKIKGKLHGRPQWIDGKIGRGVRTDGGRYVAFGDVANFDKTDAFSFGCWVKPEGDGAIIARMDDGNGYRGWDLYSQNGGQIAMHLIHKWQDDALKVTTATKIKRKVWTHVFVTYDGSAKPEGVKFYFNGVEQKQGNVEANGLRGTTKGAAPLQIGRRKPGSAFNGQVDDVRIYSKALSAAEVATVAGGDALGPILAIESAERTKEQTQTLREHYFAAVDKKIPAFNKQRADLTAQIEANKRNKNETVMVMAEMDKPRMTYLLERGHYASPDKEAGPIAPAIPAIFGELDVPVDRPANRLDLAKWIVSSDNPLTARVAVNRYWSMFFGKGIVNTVMDFGSQGGFPTHPDLLDWIADDFAQNGWNVKRTIKQILMSATYRQSSRTTSKLAQVDPVNDLLARGPRFRLQGEFIRDTALSVSGLLVDKVGGPSVKPYQPPGLWNEVALTGNVRFVQDKGEKLYRKSMYTYWKRSAPHPGMLLFDAPSREICTVERPRTNTPLQALYTLNDIQFNEAARMFAERMMTEGGSSPAERIGFGHRLITAKKPSQLAIDTLKMLYETELARYQKENERAKQLLSIGEHPRNTKLDEAEHAAWTIVASTMLNMDAALSRF